jgi:hypothetical protein
VIRASTEDSGSVTGEIGEAVRLALQQHADDITAVRVTSFGATLESVA